MSIKRAEPGRLLTKIFLTDGSVYYTDIEGASKYVRIGRRDVCGVYVHSNTEARLTSSDSKDVETA